MRIGELSRTAGVPVPTIKFYLREGLLERGIPTAANQAEYAHRHLERLHLIKTLTELGGLSLKAVRAVLKAIDDENLSLHDVLGAAHRALRLPVSSEMESGDAAAATEEIEQFIENLGWNVAAHAPARATLAGALLSLRRLGRDVDAKVFAHHAHAADAIAAREVGTVPAAASREQAVESAVVGTVIFEAALLALRRLAHEHHSSTRFARKSTKNSRRRT